MEHAAVPPRASDLAEAGTGLLTPARLAITGIALALLAIEVVLESWVWPTRLWGSHFYSFFPRSILPVALAITLLGAWIGDRIVRRAPVSSRAVTPRWLPWISGFAAALLFWFARERHLFWGDGLPLSISIPRGQSFHPDEPLTMFLHHALFRLGGGHWSGVTAVAIGSTLAGAVAVAWSVHWFTSRLQDRPLATLAIAVFFAQGFTQIFYGYVEDYSYAAVALLLFFTLGLDALAGRCDPLWPLLAALAAYAFHIAGALAFPPALILIGYELRAQDRRWATVRAMAIVAALLAIAVLATARLYGADPPFARLARSVGWVLAHPTDSRPEHVLSLRHGEDVWSVLMLVGPLSMPLLVAFALALPGGRMLRTVSGLFLGIAVLVYTAPALTFGGGNLGAPRNWDLFAAPAVAGALCALVLITRFVPVVQARRILVWTLALSLFHTVPWIALNTSPDRAAARVAALPRDNGRGEALLGTHYLNANDPARAEPWFRQAVAEAPNNVNAQSGLGLALARQRRFDAAIEPLEAAVHLRPADPQYRRDLIELWFALERWADAARELEALLALTPRDRTGWLQLAGCHLRLDQGEAATQALIRGHRALPDDSDIRAALRDVCMHRAQESVRRDDPAETARVLRECAAALAEDSTRTPPGTPR